MARKVWAYFLFFWPNKFQRFKCTFTRLTSFRRIWGKKKTFLWFNRGRNFQKIHHSKATLRLEPKIAWVSWHEKVSFLSQFVSLFFFSRWHVENKRDNPQVGGSCRTTEKEKELLSCWDAKSLAKLGKSRNDRCLIDSIFLQSDY